MHSTIVVSAENTLQAMNRIISVLRARNFRIVSLTTGRTATPAVASTTIVVDSRYTDPQRVIACLEKVEQVLDIAELQPLQVVRRELVMLKIAQTPDVVAAVERLMAAGETRVVDRTDKTLILQIVGEPEDIDTIIGSLGGPVDEIVRIGPIAIPRGARSDAQTSPQ